jgi:hypothetical protein
MIVFAREYREIPHIEQPAKPAWHAPFLALLPAIREQLRFAFRGYSPDARAEAIADGIAHAAVAFERLYYQGRSNVANASALAAFAARQFRAGRRVGSQLNVDDVSSVYSQRQRGFILKSLDQRNPAGEWKEIVVEDRRATPAEIAAARLDIADWFDGLPRLKRGIAETLATVESTKQTASMFDVTPGGVSQIRGELAESWSEFQGATLACA